MRRPFFCLKFRRSEGIDDIQYLGAVPGLLDITEVAPAARGESRGARFVTVPSFLLLQGLLGR